MAKPFLLDWRRSVISGSGPPAATTRHILLTLSVHMDADGGSCFPSTNTIAQETGLSERSVCTHLLKAEQEGWIEKEVCGVSGRGWRRNKYVPKIPSKVLKEIQYGKAKGTEIDSVPKPEGTEPLSKGTEPDDIKALNEVQSSRPSSRPKRSKRSKGSFPIFWKAYPRKVKKKEAIKIWNKMKVTPEMLEIILSALEKQKNTHDWQKDNGQFIPHPTTWLNQERWEDDINTPYCSANKTASSQPSVEDLLSND